MDIQTDPFNLRNRVALVTGAAGWLGTPIAERLCRAGAHVYLCGRDDTSVNKLAQRLTQAGLYATSLPFDVTDYQAVQIALQTIDKTEGRLDIMVNNAHSGTESRDILDTRDSDFDEAYATSVIAVWRLIQRGLPLLRAGVDQNHQASVINVVSMYAKIAPDPRIYEDTGVAINPSFYGAAKAGLLQLTRWLAARLGPDGIRVNAVSPGPFPQGNLSERLPGFVERLAARTMLGRIGERGEVAGAVHFLASDAASYITGADVPVDGGWTAW